jgi:hypothetical protein
MPNESPPPRRRSLALVDLAILAIFAALALGLAIVNDREFLQVLMNYRSMGGHWPGTPLWFDALELPSKRVQSNFAAFLIAFTPGIALATFRRPSALRHRPTMPGVLATAAASLAILVWIPDFIRRSFGIWPYLWAGPGPGFWYDMTWLHFEPYTSGAIVGVWAYLALGRRWIARDDWRDRLGRWLGWCWLGITAASSLFPILWG